jgi:hypothetical protein
VGGRSEEGDWQLFEYIGWGQVGVPQGTTQTKHVGNSSKGNQPEQVVYKDLRSNALEYNTQTLIGGQFIPFVSKFGICTNTSTLLDQIEGIYREIH